MIRLAKQEDLERLLEIYGSARAFMRSRGNMTQWAGGYPAREDLAEDLEKGCLYVAEENGHIWGCFMLTGGPDETYRVIYDGAWGWDLPYGVLHRVAVDGSHTGLVHKAVEFAAGRFDYLRIDTHKDNHPMQKALAREGFCHRGTIITGDGTPRMAYDRLLGQESPR